MDRSAKASHEESEVILFGSRNGPPCSLRFHKEHGGVTKENRRARSHVVRTGLVGSDNVPVGRSTPVAGWRC